MRLPRRARNFIRIVLSILFIFVLGEVCTTLFLGHVVLPYSKLLTEELPENPVPIAGSDYLPFTLPSATLAERVRAYGINDLGYRSVYPTQIAKPANTRRILLLGDSFTLGLAVEPEATFAQLMQNAFEGAATPVEVINAGYHDGYSPDAYYAYLMREGLALEPDLIVVNIYADNDLVDISENRWLKTDARGAPIELHTTRQYTDFRNHRHDARSFAWFYHVPVLNESRFFVAVSGFISYVFNIHPYPLPMPEAEAKYRTSLEALIAAADEQDIPIYFTVFYVEHMEYGWDYPPEKVAIHDATLNIAAEVVPPDHLLNLNGIFSSEYQVAELKNPETGRHMGHFNEAGNQLFFDALMELIAPTVSDWLPADKP
jgi:hypothetical protein